MSTELRGEETAETAAAAGLLPPALCLQALDLDFLRPSHHSGIPKVAGEPVACN